MDNENDRSQVSTSGASFFDQPGVQVEQLRIGGGVPLGIRQTFNSDLGIGGAYGTWGKPYDNHALPTWVESNLGRLLSEDDKLDLSPLGFTHRHHIDVMKDEEHHALEIEVGRRFLRSAAEACGWDPSEIQGVLIGNSGPVAPDYTVQIARAAGIPEDALKVGVHKACDGSVAALHLALNTELPGKGFGGRNIAEELHGKKVLVGGIEGLSRFIGSSEDYFGMQIFGNGAGVFGLIPGENLHFLAGDTHEVYDTDGVLQVRMYYPYEEITDSDSTIFIKEMGDNFILVAGRMHEPQGDTPLVMAGPMGMVKLFVRTGVKVVKNFVEEYQERMSKLGMTGKEFKMVIAHHANLKINQLKAKLLSKQGVHLTMPWVLSEFGNVSAASNMIAFLRKLSDMNRGDHILIYGFGAGTYYDILAVEMGGSAS